jgi:hypothetical protein
MPKECVIEMVVGFVLGAAAVGEAVAVAAMAEPVSVGVGSAVARPVLA